LQVIFAANLALRLDSLVIGIIKRNFQGLRQDTFIMLLLYKSLVRSRLKHANSLWNPYQSIRKGSDKKRLVTALRDTP